MHIDIPFVATYVFFKFKTSEKRAQAVVNRREICLRLVRVPSAFLISGFPTEIFYAFLVFPMNMLKG